MTLVGMNARPRSEFRLREGRCVPSLYSDVLHEPLPDMIAELLRQLSKKAPTHVRTAVVGCG
jgi:hypothetical protein